MTNFTRHFTALALTTVASALLLVGAVGPAQVAAPMAPAAQVVA